MRSDTVLVAHNAAFDMRFLQLKEAASGVVFDQPVLDTLLLSDLVHPQQESHGLEALAERLGVAVVGRHTALGDAVVTAEVFLKLLRAAGRQGHRDAGTGPRGVATKPVCAGTVLMAPSPGFAWPPKGVQPFLGRPGERLMAPDPGFAWPPKNPKTQAQPQGRSDRPASAGLSSSSRHPGRVVDGRDPQLARAHLRPFLHHLGGAHAASDQRGQFGLGPRLGRITAQRQAIGQLRVGQRLGT